MSIVKKEKPRLIPHKMLNYFNHLKEEEIKKQQGGALNDIINSIKEFIKTNYGFVIIVALILVLLYVRYLEVNRRKEKIKIYIDETKKKKHKLKSILKKKKYDEYEYY
jgi:predicted PurR-regulated permease PerM